MPSKRGICLGCLSPFGLAFTLVRGATINGRHTSRSCGSIFLCEECWRRFAAPHRQKNPARKQGINPATMKG